MFVCLCKAVTDHDIRNAVESGVSSFDELKDELEVGTNCGQCACEAQSIFDDKIASEAAKRGPVNAPAIHLGTSS